MVFSDLSIKETYDSDEDDVLIDFYIPVLTEATSYDRLAGFFSSTALAISARGLSTFISNGGKMRLVTSTQLSGQDLEAIKTGIMRPEEAITKLMIDETSNIADEIQKNHVAALAWMIAHGNLEIKIAIPLADDGSFLRETLDKNSIYHQKVGILSDEIDNLLSFSGSINETGKAWVGNIEEFKVFRSWIAGQEKYCTSDKKKFEKFWNDQSKNTKIFDMPTAVKEHLITLAPASIDAVIEGLEKGAGSSACSAFTGALASGCPVCTMPLLGVFGLGGALALFPLQGLELKIAAIVVLGVALYFTKKNVKIACKI